MKKHLLKALALMLAGTMVLGMGACKKSEEAEWTIVDGDTDTEETGETWTTEEIMEVPEVKARTEMTDAGYTESFSLGDSNKIAIVYYSETREDVVALVWTLSDKDWETYCDINSYGNNLDAEFNTLLNKSGDPEKVNLTGYLPDLSSLPGKTFAYLERQEYVFFGYVEDEEGVTCAEYGNDDYQILVYSDSIQASDDAFSVDHTNYVITKASFYAFNDFLHFIIAAE